LVSACSRLYLKLLGFEVRIAGRREPRPRRPALIVSNHLSYLDVLLIAGRFPGCFVTSEEVRRTPFLGHVTALAGCLFVERRSRASLGRETRSISDALKSGLDVILFPEGTSTCGETVLRFRRPLFQAALDAAADVLPVCLVYTSLDGRVLDGHNRDRLFWYGDMGFAGHFLGLAGIRRAGATLFLERRLCPSLLSNSRDLSMVAHRLVSERLRTGRNGRDFRP
jgi:1-acyl-sn-glycerol-3-phosphate acyltransferase